MTDFAGVIDTWDVINEVVIMPIFDKDDNGISRMARKLGRVGIVKATFEAARAANPRATLLLNDFDVSADYEHLVEDCLDAGIRIDALGIQSHMHQGYWGEGKTRDVLDRFARFGLPIHFTESTLVSGQLMPPEIVDLNDYQVADWPTTPEGEARQADEIVRHYKTLMADPAVAAITWWGFPDDGWLHAPTGLVRADGSRKPAYDALHRLVRGDWWLPPTTLVTGDDGTTPVQRLPRRVRAVEQRDDGLIPPRRHGPDGHRRAPGARGRGPPDRVAAAVSSTGPAGAGSVTPDCGHGSARPCHVPLLGGNRRPWRSSPSIG